MTPSAQKISHALNVMSSADSMRLEEFICDFKVKTGSKIFNTHRLILATNSGYFKGLFSSNMAEAQQDYVTMEAIESNIMQQCIEYMYTSECGLQPDSVSQVLHAANYLQISTLEKICFEYLLEILSPNNSLFVVNLAKTFNHQDVVRAAEETIQKNLETVLSLKLFKDVTEQDLLRYISDANYEVTWKALTTWCQGKEKEFPKLVENVNFSDFSFHFLLETVLKHHLVKKSQNVKSLVIKALFNDSSRLKDRLDVSNCFPLKRLSNDRESEEVILEFMKENFSSIITKPEFCSLSKPEVMSLLNFPKMEAAESKWEAILKWVKKDEHQRKQHFTDLFGKLDLSKLSFTFLKETVRQEPLVQANMTCMGLLMDAVFNHTDQGEKRSTSPSIVGVVEKPYEEEPHEDESYEASGSNKDYSLINSRKSLAHHPAAYYKQQRERLPPRFQPRSVVAPADGKRSTSPSIFDMFDDLLLEEPHESSGSNQPQQQHNTELTPGTRVARGYHRKMRYEEGTSRFSLACKKGEKSDRGCNNFRGQPPFGGGESPWGPAYRSRNNFSRRGGGWGSMALAGEKSNRGCNNFRGQRPFGGGESPWGPAYRSRNNFSGRGGEKSNRSCNNFRGQRPCGSPRGAAYRSRSNFSGRGGA